jgi:transcription elongation GreA/GreB family factor
MPVLLPHEGDLVDEAEQRQRTAFDDIIEEKKSVTGGDDWHDGAFRETDRQAIIVDLNMRAIAPYIGAAVVMYPEPNEERATLGSRVEVEQNGYPFKVDIIGFRAGYPTDMKDPDTKEDIDGTSPQMPLGGALMGKRAGEAVSFNHDGRVIEMSVRGVDQQAIREFFMHAADTSVIPVEGANEE